jgi:hypothetical protein
MSNAKAVMAETPVRFWWNRYGPMFAAEIRKKRVAHLRGCPQWRSCPDRPHSDGEMRLERGWIERAQPQGAVSMEGRDLGFVGKSVCECGEIVGRGAGRIERQGAFDCAQRQLVFLREDDDHPASHGQSRRDLWPFDSLGAVGYSN